MRELRINERFESACPPLSSDELERLERLILKDGVIINPILIWDDVIIDGHNRYDIAKRNGLDFSVTEMHFESDEDAIIWIKENAISQRNLTDFVKYELVKDIEEILKKKGQEKKQQNIINYNNGNNADMSQMTDRHSTRTELVKKSGLSSGQIAKAKIIDREAPKEVKEELRKGETTIGKAYRELKEKDAFEKHSEIDPEVNILESAASSLERWIDRNCSFPVMFDFIPEVKEMIKKLRDKKATYGK